MATSTCIKCGGTSFETCLNEPSQSGFKLIFVQCARCGGVVGVMDFWNIGQQLINLAKTLGVELPER